MSETRALGRFLLICACGLGIVPMPAVAQISWRSMVSILQYPGSAGPGDRYFVELGWTTRASDWQSCRMTVTLRDGTMNGVRERVITHARADSIRKTVVECIAGNGAGDSLRVELRVRCADGSEDVVVRRGWFDYGRNDMLTGGPQFLLDRCEVWRNDSCYRYTLFSEPVECPPDGRHIDPLGALLSVTRSGSRSVTIARGSVDTKVCGGSVWCLLDTAGTVQATRAPSQARRIQAALDNLFRGVRLEPARLDGVAFPEWVPATVECR